MSKYEETVTVLAHGGDLFEALKTSGISPRSAARERRSTAIKATSGPSAPMS